MGMSGIIELSFYACRLSVCTPRVAFSFTGVRVKCAGQLTEQIETRKGNDHVDRSRSKGNSVLFNAANYTQEPEKRQERQGSKYLSHSVTFFQAYSLPYLCRYQSSNSAL